MTGIWAQRLAGFVLAWFWLLACVWVLTQIAPPPRAYTVLEVLGITLVVVVLLAVAAWAVCVVYVTGMERGKQRKTPRTSMVAGSSQIIEPTVVARVPVPSPVPSPDADPNGPVQETVPDDVELTPISQDLEPRAQGAAPPAAHPMATRVHPLSEARSPRGPRLASPPQPSPEPQ